MTYTALLCLSMLRDDFFNLDRPGLLRLVRSCQQEDGRSSPFRSSPSAVCSIMTVSGSFTALPNGGESDLRMTYCAFVISSLLDDWSGMDLDRALAFIRKCYVSHLHFFAVIDPHHSDRATKAAMGKHLLAKPSVCEIVSSFFFG